MKCEQCGTELDRGAQSCSACGFSAPSVSKPLSLYQGMPQANEKPNRKLRTALAVGAITCLFGLIIFARSGDKGKDNNAGRSVIASDATTSTHNPTPASASLPALHFTSSGRLPITLHKLRLGMSAAEALAVNSRLQDMLADRGPGSPSILSDPSAILCCGSPVGFDDMAGLSHGRIISVGSEVHGISPEDALRFNKDTLSQLGKPDREVYAGPSSIAWVWIDGDVRFRYDSAPADLVDLGHVPAGARNVKLEMEVYSDAIEPVQNQSKSERDYNVSYWKHYWGEDAGQEIIKQLPAGLPDVKLRMTPWQLRSVLPGIELKRQSEHREQGKADAPNVHTDVALWYDLVSFVSRTWNNVPADQIPEFRRHLIEEYGAPSEELPPTDGYETITWEDDYTKIWYMFSTIKSDSQEVQGWYTDKRLHSLDEAADSANHPSEFKPAPEAHSFF